MDYWEQDTSSSKEQKPLRPKEEPIGELAVDAAKGAFWSTVYLVEYILIWFAGYPLMFFGSLFILQLFYQIDLDDATPEFWANLMLTLGALFYFAQRLMKRFIATDRKSLDYTNYRNSVRFELGLYFVANMISFYTMKIPLFRIIDRDPNATLALKVFMPVYILLIIGVKSYYEKNLK